MTYKYKRSKEFEEREYERWGDIETLSNVLEVYETLCMMVCLYYKLSCIPIPFLYLAITPFYTWQLHVDNNHC